MTWLLVSAARAASISVSAGVGYWLITQGHTALSLVFFMFSALFYVFSTNNPATLYRRLFSGCVLATIAMLAMSFSGYLALSSESAGSANKTGVEFAINPIEWWIFWGLLTLTAICGAMDWLTNKQEHLPDQELTIEVMIDHVDVRSTSDVGTYRATGRGTILNSGTLPIHFTLVEFKRRWFYKPAIGRLFYVEGSINMPPENGVFVVLPQSTQVTPFAMDIEFSDPVRRVFSRSSALLWLDDLFNCRGSIVFRADAARHSSKFPIRLVSSP